MKKTKQFAFQAILVAFLTLCVLFLAVFAQTTTCYAEDELSKTVPSIGAKSAPTLAEIIVTPTSGIDYKPEITRVTIVAYDATKTDDVSLGLKEAFNEIVAVAKTESLKSVLDTAAKKIDETYTADCLEACDLFDVDVQMDEGETATITFESPSFADVSAENPVVVLQKINGNWVLNNNVSYTEKGKITVTFDHFCPVMFLKTNPKNVEIVKTKIPEKQRCCDCCSDDCPFCPALCTENGCYCWVVYVAIALAVVLIVLAIILISKKVKEQKLLVDSEMLPPDVSTTKIDDEDENLINKHYRK